MSKSIANHHYLIEVSDMEEACHILNKIAPEHASIQTKHPEQFIDQIKFVGALFLGHYAPEELVIILLDQVMFYQQTKLLDFRMVYQLMTL